ncbi:MAG: MnhB domain-containing protein [Bacillota bacterium]
MKQNKNEGMTLIVKTITRFTVWLILLYGLYLIAHGHLSPGGGFAGGLVIALSYIHLILAYGKNFIDKRVGLGAMHGLEAFGILAFLFVGLLGLYQAGAFFLNIMDKGALFEVFSSGVIPVINVFIGLKVGAGLYIAFYYLSDFWMKAE